jgi:hypothetical protein
VLIACDGEVWHASRGCACPFFKRAREKRRGSRCLDAAAAGEGAGQWRRRRNARCGADSRDALPRGRRVLAGWLAKKIVAWAGSIARARDRQGLKCTSYFQVASFNTLICVTFRDILGNFPFHSSAPKVLSKILIHFATTRVNRELGKMCLVKNLFSELMILWNHYARFKS